MFALSVLLLVLCAKEVQSVNILDPRVYNYYFYVTTNTDVISAGLTTESEASNHWKQIGIFQGQQACGSFHVRQFLDNYPDLKQKYGTNYTAAIDYYLETGYDQQMRGYTVGGGYGRYTLGNVTKQLYISGSDRMATAIDSLVWNNTEFIANWGHGRQLQNAVHNNSGACYNPTEAGSTSDGFGNSTSIIMDVSTKDINKFTATVNPAFWTPNGVSWKKCNHSANTVNISNFIMHKEISFINNVKEYNIIEYNTSILVPLNMDMVHLEAPTAYYTQIFDRFYGVNMTSNELIVYNVTKDAMTANNTPVLFASSDGIYAMGVVPVGTPTTYGVYNFLSGNVSDAQKCTKWNVQRIYYNVRKNTWFNFTNYLCVGNLMNAKQCMIDVYEAIIS